MALTCEACEGQVSSDLGDLGDTISTPETKEFGHGTNSTRATPTSMQSHGSSHAYSWNQSEEKVKVPLYRDPANLGLSLHFWTSGFVGSGIAASINGVFAGYLNVPSYVVNGALSLNALPVIFSAVLGALSDAKPILGFHRRPYMAFGWGLIFLSISLISCLGLPDPYYCHTPDGNYLLHDPPCNPEAAHAYVPLLCCFLLASTGMAIASSAGDGLLVQIAKSENEDRRGETQAMMLMVQNCGRFCATFLAAFGFNGRLFTGSFDQRQQLDFSQYAAVFLGPIALTCVSCIFLIEERKSEKGSMRKFWRSSYHLMEGRAFASVATYLFMSASICNIKTNAGTWVSLQWAGVKMIQNQLAGLVGLIFVALGTWLMQKYFLNVSWRKIILGASLSTMALDSISQFLTIYDIVRDPYFYLGEPIVKEVPAAMMGLVTNLIANEVADDTNCALVIGMLKSIGGIGNPLASLLSNQIFGTFHPSLAERKNFIEDQPSFRQTVAESYLLSYGFCLLLMAFLPLLPSQKEDAQRRKRDWPYHPGYAVAGSVVLLVAFLYAFAGDALILDERMACSRFLGGKGC